MRMWMIPVEKLCDEHLQREHHEIHQFVTMLRGEWDIGDEALINKVITHTTRNHLFPQRVWSRHHSIAVEMIRRGIGHGDILLVPDVVNDLPSNQVTDRVVEANEQWLATKCDKCDV